jgi:hypothetical protein
MKNDPQNHTNGHEQEGQMENEALALYRAARFWFGLIRAYPR